MALAVCRNETQTSGVQLQTNHVFLYQQGQPYQEDRKSHFESLEVLGARRRHYHRHDTLCGGHLCKKDLTTAQRCLQQVKATSLS